MKICPICDQEFEDTLPTCPRGHAGELFVDDKDPLIGVIIRDRYQINQVIGRGAMGAVYKATQTNDGKEVAIKVLHTHLASNQESLKRFQYEARAASSLMHPNIVRLYDVGIGPGGQPYIAMEYLEGTTLGDFMKTRQHLNTREALPIIRQMCEALAEAHSHGVLHRDVKPANIMLMNRFGQENFVVVLDFSISKVIHRASDVDTTTPGLIFGSPAYMSPERFMGRGGDFRSDIYSVGIIMFQMLAGRAPFKSSDLYTLMNEHIGTPPPLVKDVRPDCDIPDELQDTITRALSKKEKDRQENMKQLLAEINEVYRNITTGRPSQEMPAYAPEATVTAYGGAAPSSPQPIATIQKPPESGSGSKANVFDIDPGQGLTPSVGLPVYTNNNGVNSKQLDDGYGAGLHSKLPANAGESSVSGIWSKSVANRAQAQNSSSIQVATMRNAQGSRTSFKLLAFVLVGLLGVFSVVFVILQNSGPATAIQRKIDQNELDAATEMMQNWHTSLSPGEEEAYAGLALALGKKYGERRELLACGVWLEKVPDNSKYAAEARRLLKSIRK
jgi:serine/threonine protein kinase